MTFSGDFFFLQKCLNFCMCNFLAGLHFVSEKSEDKISKCAQ